jgi:hypothetical protein
MKIYGGAEVLLHSFLTLALDGLRGQPHALAALPLEKEPPIPTESCVGPRFGLNSLK